MNIVLREQFKNDINNLPHNELITQFTNLAEGIGFGSLEEAKQASDSLVNDGVGTPFNVWANRMNYNKTLVRDSLKDYIENNQLTALGWIEFNIHPNNAEIIDTKNIVLQYTDSRLMVKIGSHNYIHFKNFVAKRVQDHIKFYIEKHGKSACITRYNNDIRCRKISDRLRLERTLQKLPNKIKRELTELGYPISTLV